MIRRIAALGLAVMLLLSVAVGPMAAASRGILAARPSSIDFHTKPVGSENYKRTKITNTSGSDVVLLVTGGLPDDFGFGLMPGSVRFSPTEFFAGWLAQGSLIATATDPNTGQVLLELSIPVSGMGTL